MAAMIVSGDCGEIIDLNRGSAIDASCQVSVPLDRQFQRRLLEIDESETRIACGGHVLNDQDEISTIYRGPHVDASINFRFIWQNRFRGEDF